MAKTVKKQETTVVTRAEKKDATKNIIRELLAVRPLKHNELIDEVAKIYAERFGGEDTENVNDVKGRVGSVLDIMKKESDVMYEGGMYALKARLPVQAAEEKPVKKTTRAKAKKTVEEKAEDVKTEEKPKRKTTKKAEKKPVAAPKPTEEEEVILPLPPAPIQPIAPVAPITPEVAPEPIPPQEEPAPKKRGRKAKAKTEEVKAEEIKTEEPPVVTAEEKPEIVETPETPVVAEVKNPPVVKEKAEVAKKNVVMDMSFLFGDKKPAKAEAKAEVKAEKSLSETAKEEPKKEEKAALPVKTEQKIERRIEKAPAPVVKKETRVIKAVRKAVTKPLSADEKLCEAFLKRMRALGGDYFEYYSVYLLERYSMKNGRRLEGLKICGGDHDGGIDGEIELTDKFGFKETIYIQSKNWDPEKGDERLWVVGETLLQQFIGACACKQAKDGKQHCRGIFITTSRFTPEAKRILESMSDKIIGYDGIDLYEAAKECNFGVIKKNGEWALDDKLLSSTKAFFNML